MKTCSKCGVEKPLEEFHKDARQKYGVRPDCKSCAASMKQQFYSINSDKYIQYQKEHKKENKIYVKKYNKTAKGIAHNKAGCHKRREYVRKNGGKFTGKQIIDMYEYQQHLCNHCCGSLDELGYHIDHIVPLSLGGTNWIDNIQLLCPKCNLMKGDKFMFKDFLKLLGTARFELKEDLLVHGRVYDDVRTRNNMLVFYMEGDNEVYALIKGQLLTGMKSSREDLLLMLSMLGVEFMKDSR